MLTEYRDMRYAVVLAGGSGVRLWPASRQSRPKQFLSLGTRADESLLAATARRIAPLCPSERTLVVTAAHQAQSVCDALPLLKADNVLAEPVARNTAAALGLAAAHLSVRDPDAIMGVLPADHHIVDESGFVAVAERAFDVAERHDVIVTIGIVPTRPETGYGYLQVGQRLDEHAERVLQFVEKPDRDTAERYVASGDYLWNGGMFFVRASRLLGDLQAFMPETYAGLMEIQSALSSGGMRAAMDTAERVYPRFPKVSIDYGVMERARDVCTIRGDFGWNDVGSWSALADYRAGDERGNIVEGTVIAHDAADNIAIAADDTAIALIGVSGLVVIKSGDGLLIVPRDRAQDVRAVVDIMKQRGYDRYL